MGKVKGYLALLAGLFILIAFLSWRIPFKPPFISKIGYLIVGLILVAALFWGRLISPYLALVGLFCIGLPIIAWLFKIKFQDETIKPLSMILIGIVCLAVAGILQGVGSSEVEKYVQEKEAHENRDVICAKCSQYLGKASGFDSPCPRCGSNRYIYED